MQRTVCIPEGEDGIVSVLGICILMHLLIHPTEGAIDILIVIRSYVGMVESRIEVT